VSELNAPTRFIDIHTVGVPVRDQDRALEFYTGKLGFETRMDAAFGEGQRWIEVAPPGATTSIALVRAPSGTSVGVDTGIRLATEDAAADHAALRAAGVDVDAEVTPYPVPMFLFRDPEGNQLVAVERPPEG
jgi:catechol 2,3-dioxygenase-like lactoylglutathione lyase family enzyme